MNTADPTATTVVIVFGDRINAISYKVEHGFTFAVVPDYEHRFAVGNKLPFEPMIMVVDPQGNVVHAVSPVVHKGDVWSAATDRLAVLVTRTEPADAEATK